ncbi:hypothetical protein COO60DRAFT_1546185 [Scenedesmus sp. NREL 46B-D3]|nr:hypothetical protein COO60DRAFT_1546185 [Scenedesmus sp. NREL 46B-D3]
MTLHRWKHRQGQAKARRLHRSSCTAGCAAASSANGRALAKAAAAADAGAAGLWVHCRWQHRQGEPATAARSLVHKPLDRRKVQRLDAAAAAAEAGCTSCWVVRCAAPAAWLHTAERHALPAKAGLTKGPARRYGEVQSWDWLRWPRNAPHGHCCCRAGRGRMCVRPQVGPPLGAVADSCIGCFGCVISSSSEQTRRCLQPGPLAAALASGRRGGRGAGVACRLRLLPNLHLLLLQQQVLGGGTLDGWLSWWSCCCCCCSGL